MPEENLFDVLLKNRISGSERVKLIEKCQENGWLKFGGYDWQDDPFLEEYPYQFCRIDDINVLREYFACGNWAIRQGAIFGDLAFINQVNGGDEWWTLKRDGRDWTAFESTSFALLIEAKGNEAFEALVRSMQLATPAQCRSLDYYDKDAVAKWNQMHGATGPDCPRSLSQRAAEARESASALNLHAGEPRRESLSID